MTHNSSTNGFTYPSEIPDIIKKFVEDMPPMCLWGVIVAITHTLAGIFRSQHGSGFAGVLDGGIESTITEKGLYGSGVR